MNYYTSKRPANVFVENEEIVFYSILPMEKVKWQIVDWKEKAIENDEWDTERDPLTISFVSVGYYRLETDSSIRKDDMDT